jgi:RND family efflux transporter MFP subunit
MSEAQISEMDEKRQLPESVDIVSPTDGFVIARNISPGQHFDRSMEFYRVADLSRVWILADIFQEDAHKVHPGAVAHVSMRDHGKTFIARVIDVLPQVDPATRTLKLRLEVENPSFILRPDMFVDVQLASSLPEALTVPADAVIDSGLEQRVFVQRADGAFEPRTVRTGWHAGDRVQIVSGLAEGERVVAEGTFLIDSESRLKLTTSAVPQPHNGHVPEPSNTGSATALSAAKNGKMSCGMTTDGSTSDCKMNVNAPPEHYLASTH